MGTLGLLGLTGGNGVLISLAGLTLIFLSLGDVSCKFGCVGLFAFNLSLVGFVLLVDVSLPFGKIVRSLDFIVLELFDRVVHVNLKFVNEVIDIFLEVTAEV